MKNIKSERVKGFNDYTGKEAQKRAEIKKILAETFESYCFEPAETPVIEYEDFVKGSSDLDKRENDEVISDIFKLKDKGKRNLALRYEFTFQLKRLIRNKKLPYKRYQIGKVFRDEPVSANRFREFIQADADIIGSNIKNEAEILSLVGAVLEKLGIKYSIYINNRKLLNEILKDNGTKEKDRFKIIKELDKLDKLPESEVRENLKKYNADKVLNIFKKPEAFFKKYDSYKYIEELKKYCKIYNINIKFQPNLARGLSYYDGMIFEVKTTEKKIKETICAGGSFTFNKINSTGVSFGLERISKLAKINLEKEKYLIVSLNQDKEAIKLAQRLRKRGKAVMIYYGKPSKALEYANAYNMGKVIFVGEKEVKKNKFKIKDMISGKEIFEKFSLQ